jgi:hypothetical protein
LHGGPERRHGVHLVSSPSRKMLSGQILLQIA